MSTLIFSCDKMIKTFILLILFTIWTLNSNEISCQRQAKPSKDKFPPLRRLGISFKVNVKNDNSNKKQRESNRNDEKLSEEEMMRQRIYVTNLLKFQGGSNILKDFLTNRF